MNENEILQAFANLIKGTNTKLTIKKAISNLMDYCNVKGCREQTIVYYKNQFNTLNIFFNEYNLIFIEDITKSTMNTLIMYLKEKGLKNSSINKYISSIKYLVKYNFDNEFTMVNNIQSFKKLKEDTPIIKTITNENLEKIKTYLNNLDTNNLTKLRFKVFVSLLMNTGARFNEIMHIEINNIDLDKNTILLTFTKTSKERYVFFNNSTKESLKKLINILKSQNCNTYLFINLKTGNIIVRDTLIEQINKMKKKLNIEQSISPHKWRHTLATQLCENNVNIKSIQETLGHCTLEMTKKYIHQSTEKRKKDIMEFIQ